MASVLERSYLSKRPRCSFAASGCPHHPHSGVMRSHLVSRAARHLASCLSRFSLGVRGQGTGNREQETGNRSSGKNSFASHGSLRSLEQARQPFWGCLSFFCVLRVLRGMFPQSCGHGGAPTGNDFGRVVGDGGDGLGGGCCSCCCADCVSRPPVKEQQFLRSADGGNQGPGVGLEAGG